MQRPSLQLPWPYAPLWDVIQDTTGVDLGAAATTVTLTGLGAWLLTRVVKIISGRLEAEEVRLTKQEAEVTSLRVAVTDLRVQYAKCESEREANARALAQALIRIDHLEQGT